MRKKLPVGIDGFEKIRTNDFYYADKTMWIADLLCHWGEVNLVTRPRRFGKSLNMSMLKSFFETGTDRSLFEGLRISREKELCGNYMGKFPVLSLTLKGIDGLNFRDACAAFRRIIGREAGRFGFLSESGKLSAGERALYQGMIRVENGDFVMPDDVLADSIRTLSELLCKHYGQKVIILIDEYDVPLDKAFQAGYYEEMVSLLRRVFSNALKTNESLHFAVLTGCLRISRESIFTGLNNLKIHTILDSRYDEYFGFTEEDVKEMLAFYGLSDHADTIREWYDGYRFGNAKLYCPWDVLNFCDALLADPDAEPRNYWANTSGNAMVRLFIGKADRQTRSEIERLIEGGSIAKRINQELTYGELDRSIDHLWSILFTTGYLTQCGRTTEGQWKLTIPNQEVRELFLWQIRDWFQEDARTDTGKLERLCAAFVEGNADVVQELLNGYLWRSISIRDTASRKEMKENFYHGMLLGLLQYESSWEVESNAESGEGYSDIYLRTPDRVGVVIEIKYADDGDLEKGCREALFQMEEKQYDAALKKDGMGKIIKFGIAFYKKNCRVVCGKAEYVREACDS